MDTATKALSPYAAPDKAGPCGVCLHPQSGAGLWQPWLSTTDQHHAPKQMLALLS